MQFLHAVYCFVFNIFLQLTLKLVAIFFIFYWYLLVPALKQQFNEPINGKSQTNRDQKSNSLFLQPHNQSQKFRVKLVKNRQKTLQRHWCLLYWIHYHEKNWWLWKYLLCKSFYLLVNYASGYIEKKYGNKYFIFDDSVNENKGLLK